jgi:major membrane immunogen (membrane-anchored lipoprotein)
MRSPLARLKGYILDLTYGSQRNYTWATTIRNGSYLGQYNDSGDKEFSHIIEILLDDDEIYHRAETMRLDPSTGQVHSNWDREERKKPKPIPEGEEEAPEEDEENIIKPLVEDNLIQRPCDTEE